jgi:hypothetical protein
MLRRVAASNTRVVYRAISRATQYRSNMFSAVKPGPPDPMYAVKKACDEDHDAQKVDLGVGIYRNEEGLYHELDALKRVCSVLCEAGCCANGNTRRPRSSWTSRRRGMM